MAVVLLLCCFGFWGPISVTWSGMVLVWSNWRNRQMSHIDFQVKTFENVGVANSQSAITSVEPSQQHEWFRCVMGSNTTRRVVLCYSNFWKNFGPQHSVTNTTRGPRVVLFVLSVLWPSLNIWNFKNKLIFHWFYVQNHQNRNSSDHVFNFQFVNF